MSFLRRSLFYFLAFPLLVSVVDAAGLSTSFVDVAVMDVPLGAPRRVEDKDGKSFVIWNTGEMPLIVHLEAVKPSAQELKTPAEAIEDPSWITITPATITLAPHETGQCDVVMLLPKDKKLRHRLFQAMIWAHSEPVGSQGVTVSAGLKSRLRFRTTR